MMSSVRRGGRTVREDPVMNRRRRRLVAAVLCVLIVAICVGRRARAQDKPPKHAVRTHRDIAYVTGPGADAKKHRLDVYAPEGVKNAPVLVMVHGGAWQHGGKIYNLLAGPAFAEHGIVAVSVNYRLSPGTKHPAQIRDVARAFDWVRKHVAEYGGDPRNVFLTGHSAGGHLVALLAVNRKYLKEVGRTPDEIVGVIPISGLYRVGATSFIFKNTFDPDKASLIDASPEFHVGDKQPPFLIIYAQHDLPLLDIQAIGMERALLAHRSPVELMRADDRNHLTILLKMAAEDDPTTGAMLKFIRKHGRHPKP